MWRTLVWITGLTTCVSILSTAFLASDKFTLTKGYIFTVLDRVNNSEQTSTSNIYRPNTTNDRTTLPSSNNMCPAKKTKNVLFLIVDDLVGDLPLRPDDQSQMSNGQRLKIPNLRRLAETSLVLRAAYSQYPLCNPSRSSMLTGRRPDTTRVFDLKHSFRTVGGNFTTIPEFFKQKGYNTIGMGKVFHRCRGAPSYLKSDPQSWSVMLDVGEVWDNYWREKFKNGWQGVSKETRLLNPLPDKIQADKALEVLHKHANTCDPFFLAVGFHQPHEPMVYPKEIVSHYPLDLIKLPQTIRDVYSLSNYTLTEMHTLAF